MKAGNSYNLKVLRESPIAYELENKIFLHKNEVTSDIKINDMIEVFLYYDKKKRLAATMHKPLITLNKPNFVEVEEVIPDLGVFVNIGISKDILLSKDYLKNQLWPQKGDKLFLKLKENKDTLEAIFPLKEELNNINNVKYNLHDKVKAYVQKVGRLGTNLYTLDQINIFVYYKNQRDELRLGEEKEVEIININEKNVYLGSLIKNKEFMIDDDSKKILDFLIKNKGGMPYTSDTDPETIYNIFKMSKKAFKRALGHLYKERKILITEKMIYLYKEEETIK